jgi:hypothetical protein
MKISQEKMRTLCARRKTRLGRVLRAAGVSRTAYYALARKDSVLPKSLERIAAHLEVSPLDFLDDTAKEACRVRRLQAEAEAIHTANANLDRDTVYRTLENLTSTPIARLRRALIRGTAIHLQR